MLENIAEKTVIGKDYRSSRYGKILYAERN